MYDYRGIDGTGTATNPMSNKTSTNYVEYVVRKLADGNCWMGEDLKLKLVAGTPITRSNATGSEQKWTPTGTGGYDANEAINSNTVISSGLYYYSWYAATAGSGSTSATNTRSSWSICPAKWILPYSNALGKSYTDLIAAYNLTADTELGYNSLTTLPLSFSSGGWFYHGKNYYGSRASYYWMASAGSDNINALHLLASSGRLIVAEDYKIDGFLIRCIAI